MLPLGPFHCFEAFSVAGIQSLFALGLVLFHAPFRSFGCFLLDLILLSYFLNRLLVAVIQRRLDLERLLESLYEVSAAAIRAGLGRATDKVKKPLEIVNLALLNEQMGVIEILNDDFIVVLGVDVHDYGLDGRLTRDECAWVCVRWGNIGCGGVGEWGWLVTSDDSWHFGEWLWFEAGIFGPVLVVMDVGWC